MEQSSQPESAKFDKHLSKLKFIDEPPNPFKHESAYLFKHICIVQVIFFLDCGSLPAVLNQLKQANQFDLDYIMQGGLSASLYFALSVACPIAGYTLRNWKVRKVLSITFWINTLGILAFAACPPSMAWVLILARTIIGFTQAFMTIFSPIWIDDFAPEEKRTLWMSSVQGAIPVSIVLGYALAYICVSRDSCFLMECWRWPFLIQAVLMVPICIGTWYIPDRHLQPQLHEDFWRMQYRLHDRPEYSHTTDADNDDDHLSGDSHRPYTTGFVPVSSASAFAFENVRRAGVEYVTDAKELLSNGIFVFTVMSLTAFFFVATGTQYWSTDYMITNEHSNPNVAMGLFMFTAATAPVCGVFFGGISIDKFGGYRGVRQREKALRLCLIFGLLACVSGLPATFVGNVYIFTLCIWLMTFFGGAYLPASTGIYVSSVPLEKRAFASALSVIFFNLFGYSLSPLLASLLMQWTGSYSAGYQLTVCWSLFGELFLFFAWYYSRQAVVKLESEEEGGAKGRSGLEEDDDTFALDEGRVFKETELARQRYFRSTHCDLDNTERDAAEEL